MLFIVSMCCVAVYLPGVVLLELFPKHVTRFQGVCHT